MNDVWKKIKGFNNLYEISDYGCVRNRKTGKIKKISILPKGYCQISLNHDKREYIHRLVAKTFLPGIHGKNEINHKDGNKSNNHISNLEWVTHSENQHHAYRILKTLKLNFPCSRGENNPMAKLTHQIVEKIRMEYLAGTTQRKIAEKYGIVQSHVSSIC